MKLIEFSKTECGVDFLMKVGPKKDLKGTFPMSLLSSQTFLRYSFS